MADPNAVTSPPVNDPVNDSVNDSVNPPARRTEQRPEAGLSALSASNRHYDVVIAGAGLSGLAAAEAVQQRGLRYAVVELKPFCGGRLHTVEQDGVVYDEGPAILADDIPRGWLEEHDLLAKQVIVPTGMLFERGHRMLTEALRRSLTGDFIAPQVVRGIEQPDTASASWLVCLKHGQMLSARGLILALPASYLQVLFERHLPAAAPPVQNHLYDSVHRLSLLYDSNALPDEVELPPDIMYPYLHRIDDTRRVPAGRTMLQVGMRIRTPKINFATFVGGITQHMRLPVPDAAYLSYWPTAESLTIYDDDYPQRMQQLRDVLPPTLRVVGSDTVVRTHPRRGVQPLWEIIDTAQREATALVDTLDDALPG